MRQPVTGPIAKEKIQLIKDLLNDPEVNQLWVACVRMAAPESPNDYKLINARKAAFLRYAIARDRFLGLPLLSSSCLK